MSDESTAPFGVTFKGQGQNDPWITVRATSIEDFRSRLNELDRETLELTAGVAAEHVSALNAQPGISQQRDNKAAAPAAQPAAAASAPFTPSPAAGGSRPTLTSSLEPESDGNYWIAVPYQRNAQVGARQRDRAKALGAQFRADEAPPSVPRKNGKPERPWQVHTQFVSEENQAELLRLHETGFKEIT